MEIAVNLLRRSRSPVLAGILRIVKIDAKYPDLLIVGRVYHDCAVVHGTRVEVALLGPGITTVLTAKDAAGSRCAVDAAGLVLDDGVDDSRILRIEAEADSPFVAFRQALG